MARVWVVVPALNEAAKIGEVVSGLVRLGYSVAAVDDGSSDETAAEARANGAAVVRHAVNLGQGAALRTGIELALSRGAERLVTFDADGQHNAEDVPKLLEALDRGYDVAVGSRFLGEIRGAPWSRRVMLRVAVFVSNALAGLSLTDAHCGLRAFTAGAARQLQISQNGMAHASEILYKLKRARLSVTEVPVTVSYSEYSRKKGQSGLQAVRILFDYLFKRPTLG